MREVIPERRMHAKGSGAFGKFTVTHDITKYTKAAIFSEVGKETELFARFTTVAGERGAAYETDPALGQLSLLAPVPYKTTFQAAFSISGSLKCYNHAFRID